MNTSGLVFSGDSQVLDICLDTGGLKVTNADGSFQQGLRVIWHGVMKIVIENGTIRRTLEMGWTDPACGFADWSRTATDWYTVRGGSE
jgi:hypothetical protein